MNIKKWQKVVLTSIVTNFTGRYYSGHVTISTQHHSNWIGEKRNKTHQMKRKRDKEKKEEEEHATSFTQRRRCD